MPFVLKIAIVIWMILTAVVGALFYMQLSTRASTRIVLHLTDALQDPNLSFGLLHIRDGKNEGAGSGPVINKEILFRTINHRGTLEAPVRYQKNLGFQFKCFVDYSGPYSQEKLEQLLAQAGFENISVGEGRRHRIWFTLKDYPIYRTVDGFINNFFYPA